MLVTYGLAQNAMRAVLRLDVPRAILANEIRAVIGRPESMTKRTGDRLTVRPMDDNEKIFKLRKGFVNGPR